METLSEEETQWSEISSGRHFTIGLCLPPEPFERIVFSPSDLRNRSTASESRSSAGHDSRGKSVEPGKQVSIVRTLPFAESPSFSVAECLAGMRNNPCGLHRLFLLLRLGAYEYLTQKSNDCNVGISRLFIYYNARVLRHSSGLMTDSGCSVSNGIEALEEYGACLETVWPYDPSRVNARPNDAAYRQAEQHKINEASHLNLDLNEMKSCLAQGFPFAFGLRLYSSFDCAAKNGVVTVPTVREQDCPSNGGLAMSSSTTMHVTVSFL